MTHRAPTTMLYRAPDAVGESPLWDASRGCLWWVDIAGRFLRRFTLATGEVASIAMPAPPGAIALGEDHSVLVAMGSGWWRLAPGDSQVSRIAEAPAKAGGWRMNDGVVDPAGRFWAGSVEEPRGSGAGGRLFRLDGSGARQMLDGLLIQNGTAIAPDGRTFYLSDSHPDRSVIWAFDFDVARGELSNRRVFHAVEGGRPDGAAIDRDGCYWFAAIDAGAIVRLDPDGQRMLTLELPVSRPTNLAFGGPDLSTLFITSMRNGLDRAALEAEPLAGAVLAVDVDVKGWPQPAARIPLPERRAGELSMTS